MNERSVNSHYADTDIPVFDDIVRYSWSYWPWVFNYTGQVKANVMSELTFQKEEQVPTTVGCSFTDVFVCIDQVTHVH